MSSKLLLLNIATIGLAPAVLWASLSIATSVVSLIYRPVSISFRLYPHVGAKGISLLYELPFLPALCILAGAGLVIFGIASIPRAN